MKLIAVEEHFVTPDVLNAWSTIRGGDDGTLAFAQGVFGERLSSFSDLRLELMNETGVDVQVLSLAAAGLNNLGSHSIDLAKKTNDLLASVVARDSARFQAIATLPSPEPLAAAKELERAVVELGFKGAMLYGRIGPANLDHVMFWPTFERAEALGVPLFIHPQIPQAAVRKAYYNGFDDMTNLGLAAFGIGWHYEAGMQFIRLILAGVFDRYPKLQVILGHWGEVVLFYIERLAMMDNVTKLQKPLMDYVWQNLYLTGSGMFSAEYLRRSVDIVGVDRILFSTDYPYQYRPGNEARKFLDGLVMNKTDKAKFAHGNWERLTNQA